jgi:DNA repair protein RadA/Sms
MIKQKQSFHCSQCDYRPPKWLGCCPSCNQWGSINAREIVTEVAISRGKTASIVSLLSVETVAHVRLVTDVSEWDRVVGGGIMPGSLSIITGDPGIGKSTLLLQIASILAAQQVVLYISSEESLEQVKQRAERITSMAENLYFANESDIDIIIATTLENRVQILIIDSIQNCYSQATKTMPGSVAQLREGAFAFMRLAKEHGITIILTGHITKEGVMAGPKMLEHMVDAVFYLQGEDRWHMRILRCVKNRFGPVHELGFFQMQEHGLQEVTNINQHVLDDYIHTPGSILISSIEGSRPILLELQALTIPTKFAAAQRVASGIDHKQVVLIAAILEKYLHIKFSEHDIFIKLSGGFTVRESGSDLGIALALLSSFFQVPLPEKALALGEINLTGHIKPINRAKLHIQEAERFGITNFLLAKGQEVHTKITSRYFQNVYELMSLFPQ